LAVAAVFDARLNPDRVVPLVPDAVRPVMEGVVCNSNGPVPSATPSAVVAVVVPAVVVPAAVLAMVLAAATVPAVVVAAMGSLLGPPYPFRSRGKIPDTASRKRSENDPDQYITPSCRKKRSPPPAAEFIGVASSSPARTSVGHYLFRTAKI
jgi:hypothetical protein